MWELEPPPEHKSHKSVNLMYLGPAEEFNSLTCLDCASAINQLQFKFSCLDTGSLRGFCSWGSAWSSCDSLYLYVMFPVWGAGCAQWLHFSNRFKMSCFISLVSYLLVRWELWLLSSLHARLETWSPPLLFLRLYHLTVSKYVIFACFEVYVNGIIHICILPLLIITFVE